MIERYRHPFRFYFYSALIPWALWLLAAWFSHGPDAASRQMAVSVLGLAGLCGPVAVAAYYAWKDGVLADVIHRFLNFRGSRAGYYILALLLMPASILLAMAISLLFGYSANQFVITGHASFTSGVLPVWFILAIAPVLEELAWHTYGTDCLRQRFNLFDTSMIFAVYWALWHVPLAMIKGYYHANLVVEGALYSINFLVSIFPFVLLMNWLYYKTGRNILIAIVLHLGANVFNEIFATHPFSKVIQTGLLLLLCAVIVTRERKTFFARSAPDDTRQTKGSTLS
jgi:membrane protease YdiL (CAAX protease family)